MAAYLDHYQTEQLGLYWRHYPEMGLDEGLFYNLLLNEVLLVSADAIYPDETSAGPWGKEFERFLEIGKIKIIQSSDLDSLERTSNALFSGKLQGLNLPDFEDVFNYDYCAKKDIPFCISKRRTNDIGEIILKSIKAFGAPANTNNNSVDCPDNRASSAEWLIDLEIPALTVRNQERWQKLSPKAPHLIEHLTFVSPKELCEIFENEKQSSSIRGFLLEVSSRIKSKAEMADTICTIKESLDTKLGNSDLVFAGLNVGLFWVPFSSLALTPAQLVTNRYIENQYQWLIFLSSTNRNIRNGESIA